MTEIQFLAQLLLNDSLSGEIKKQIVDRIVEVEQQKLTLAPMVIPGYGPQPTFPIGVTPFMAPSGPTSGLMHSYLGDSSKIVIS